jgi:hypothetical protein
MTNTANLSPEARAALSNVGNSSRGALLPPRGVTNETVAELIRHGLIGRKGGLTDRGSAARERIVAEDLDAAF